MSSPETFSTSDTESTTTPIMPRCVTSTTMMQVWSVFSRASNPNFSRRSITGITRPRRLMTPRTWLGICGTCVMSIALMISRTFSTGRPYSSTPSANVRYFPPPSAWRRPVSVAFAVVLLSLVCMCAPRRPSGGGSDRVRFSAQREQPAGIEDEPDAAVSQDCPARDAAHVPERVAERLDHDFVLADQLVDDERERTIRVLDDHHRGVDDLPACAVDPERLPHMEQRNQLLADAHHALAPLQRVQLVGQRP